MTCATCNGRKSVIRGIFEVDCPSCKGTGEVGNPDACLTCNGSRKSVANVGGINVEIDCPNCVPPLTVLRNDQIIDAVPESEATPAQLDSGDTTS